MFSQTDEDSFLLQLLHLYIHIIMICNHGLDISTLTPSSVACFIENVLEDILVETPDCPSLRDQRALSVNQQN